MKITATTATTTTTITTPVTTTAKAATYDAIVSLFAEFFLFSYRYSYIYIFFHIYAWYRELYIYFLFFLNKNKNKNETGAGGAKNQQGEKEVAEADRVSVHDQVPQQPARPTAGPPLFGSPVGPRQVRQVQAHHPGERLQVEGMMVVLLY